MGDVHRYMHRLNYALQFIQTSIKKLHRQDLELEQLSRYQDESFAPTFCSTWSNSFIFRPIHIIQGKTLQGHTCDEQSVGSHSWAWPGLVDQVLEGWLRAVVHTRSYQGPGPDQTLGHLAVRRPAGLMHHQTKTVLPAPFHT